MRRAELYLGSGEENIDAINIKRAESVDGASVNNAMPEVNPMHNPDAEEVR